MSGVLSHLSRNPLNPTCEDETRMTSIIHFLCRPRILSKALAASFLLNVATGAIADDLTVGEYQKYRDEPRIRSYLSGVFQGIHYANSLLELELKPRLYCPPDKL